MQTAQPTLAVVQYIREHGLDALQKNYAISPNRHQAYSNLVCLSYNQTRAKFDNTITLQSRGLILDESSNYHVVCFPYEKFFNYGEPLATWSETDLSDSSIKVYEKMDGSIATLYYYDDKWHVSSSAIPDGSGNMGFSAQQELRIKFADLFWDIFEQNEYQLPPISMSHYCFMFEMLTHRHPLVVQHKQEKLILHGARDLRTLREINASQFVDQLNWQVAEDIKQKFEMFTMDRVKECADVQDPLSAEGFVVCKQVLEEGELCFKRVKIKNPEYVRISLMFYDSADNREKSFLNLVKTNEGAEFLTYFPHFKIEYDKMRVEYEQVCKCLSALFSELCPDGAETPTEDARREFASKMKQVQKEKKFPKQVSDVMFALHKGEIIEDCLKKANLKNYRVLVSYFCRNTN
jgi:hypothetical protein